MSAPKKPTRRDGRGGPRRNSGRPKALVSRQWKSLPYRLPFDRHAETVAKVLAHAAASGRTPGQVLVDAVAMLPES